MKHLLPRGLFVALCLLSGVLSAQDAELVEKEEQVDAQSPGGPWKPAVQGQKLAFKEKVRTGEFSRAAVRLTDASMIRMDEFSEITLLLSADGKGKTLEQSKGGVYFFSREKDPEEVQIRTPAANGALRGTQLIVRVSPLGKTLMTVLEGRVDLSNALGRVQLESGEQGEAEIGKAPRKTAAIYSVNLLQWALYYPGVLEPGEMGLSAREKSALAASLAAYEAGDLLGALAKHPSKRGGGSAAERLYRAQVVLAVGQVDEAEKALAGVPRNHPGRQALEKMIAAVKFVEVPRDGEPATVSAWMAESYYQQSRSNLDAARDAARKATELGPHFGYAWTRLAEMEFSFGRTRQALAALERGLELTPRNAQAHALRGFLLSAQNSIGQARASFDEAIALDGALGNAWLGRGLTFIRQGEEARGRRDLQTATVMEPTRSIFHSYLGKAFSQEGDTASARKDLARAKELDPNDPTPFLYSAIQNKQENRYNAAVRDLEASIALNDNRRVYRSQFLLDQDRGVRGTNLAAIYLDEGMIEQSVREAVRAVNSDYASAPAHLFLANSYDALRDPRRIQLRYETLWFNELLLANLLSPVGGGPLSQYVSQQEYSKLFEADGFGISSVTDYFSTGELRETASQYGTFGNISYALDAEYQYDTGFRPNNEISRFESYATFKLQLTPQDIVFFQTKYQDLHSGDLRQKFDARGSQLDTPSRTLDFNERQEPGLLLLGLRHEWNPGIHTLLLLGRLANDQVLTTDGTNSRLFFREADASEGDGTTFEDVRRRVSPFLGRGTLSGVDNLGFDLDYRANFETYSAELNQIITLGPQTFVFGARYQQGEFETHVRLRSDVAELNNALSDEFDSARLFDEPLASQDAFVDFQRLSIYAYDIFRVARWLTLTAGLTYDDITYPENFRSAPVTDREDSFDRLSPKFGLIATPFRGTVLRAAYTESIGGASFDESIRLEPTQVAGFSQASRTLISESVAGSVAAPRYRTYGVSLEQKLPSLTYLGIEVSRMEQRVDRINGAFDFLQTPQFDSAILASSIEERLEYREDTLAASVNQLLGEEWAMGARYRFTKSQLRSRLPSVPRELLFDADQTQEALLHEVGLYALFNHGSGFFARAEANWFIQENDSHPTNPALLGRNLEPGDDFWQLNVFAGYRFLRNQCEVSCGVVNLTDQDYRLNPLNPYSSDLPREQSFVVRARFSF